MRILALCTGNSARSILLEGLLGHHGFTSFSAGSHPVGQVNPVAIRTLLRHGIELENPRSKSWDEFSGPAAPTLDLVITVCASAAGETCPIWLGGPMQVHWGVDDPAGVEDEPLAFENAFQTLQSRVIAFAALKDKTDRAVLMDIGRLS